MPVKKISYSALRKYLVLLCSIFLIAGLAESSSNKDYPLISSYAGAKLTATQFTDYDSFTFPISKIGARNTPYQFKNVEVKGRVLKYIYSIKNISTLKIYENYVSALNNLNFKVIYACELNTCGDESGMEALGKMLAIDKSTSSTNEKPYYVVAEKFTEKGKIYGAWLINGVHENAVVQQVIVEEQLPDNDLIKIDPAVLKQQIDADGKALIYGIYFDTGEAIISSASKPALDAIAQLLTKNRELSLYVVGHTDDIGSAISNVELSRQRATAVVNELVDVYKILPSRLEAQGVGAYAPTSNNTSEEGRQRNRRVELVKHLQ